MTSPEHSAAGNSASGSVVLTTANHWQAGVGSLRPRVLYLTARVLAVATIAGVLALGQGSPALASGMYLGWKDPVCDLSMSPRLLYVGPPLVTAYDDTPAPDTNVIRYWTRLYDSTTGAALTDWSFGGEARTTENAYAPFQFAARAYDLAYGVKLTIAARGHVRVQYFVAWYRADGSLRSSLTRSVTNYKRVIRMYAYPSGAIPMLLQRLYPTC